MNQPVTALIRQRFSCRSYTDENVGEEQRRLFAAFLAANNSGPFATPVRFALAIATEEDRQALKGLGTYGFIRGATGFIIGAVKPAPHDMEDFGYLMEQAILFATDIGLGTCWLGGSFTKSSFARKIAATREETVPAVTSIGYIAEGGKARDRIRRRAGSDNRLPPEELFFDRQFGRSLAPAQAGAYAEPLAMVRQAPSASNKQPWRLIRDGDCWHFYLQRTKGYGKGSFVYWLLGLADLQRVDMGIAMCHFELTARELGLAGRWLVNEPDIAKPGAGSEYIVTWMAE